MFPETNKSEQAANASSDENDRSPQPKGNTADEQFFMEAPQINLPKGGGAIRSIDEKFTVNAINGTATLNIPLPFSSGRGASPSLELTYNSGLGNGPFGLGWIMKLSSIKRKTDKELPQYFDQSDSDTYLLADAEDLVPELQKDEGGNWVIHDYPSPDGLYTIRRYHPRIEGLFSRIERWWEISSGLLHWRVISKENITTLYGLDAHSTTADPSDNRRIFEWLPGFSFDDKGNCVQYEYKQEDGANIDGTALQNRNRANGSSRVARTYLKRVRYGNSTPYRQFNDPIPNTFCFEMVFDYGEHDPVNIPFAETGTWDVRSDAFSDYRAGFEIRTSRLCKRVLSYHHFNELPGGSALVKSLLLTYDNNAETGLSYLREATLTGYTQHDDGSYTQKSLPPFSFGYQPIIWNEDICVITPDDAEHAPAGLDAPNYQFVDLYSEGLSGILTEQADAWWYKSNLGNGRFTPAGLVSVKPSFSGLSDTLMLLDLEADGTKQVVSFQSEPTGYFELQEQRNAFTPFKQMPVLNFKDKDVRMIDLNGDGKADLLVTEDDVFTIWLSDGKEGFAACTRLVKSYDEEKGAAVLFSDLSQTIFLADMSGDGLTDIVRIRNGEVCYWPNLGFGRFGARVSMDGAPVFDHSDNFDPSLIRLADIDGSGTTDIVYLGRNQFTIWFNQQGNQFAEQARTLQAFPPIIPSAEVSVIDLLATGVPAVVWSSDLPGFAQPFQYIDLLSSIKPHLLVSYKNNLGREVQLEYKPSTAYYIADKLAGSPWVTKLPFPVHCISRLTTFDRIMKTQLVTEYSYHHGYFDHPEREFRGFGRVDQRDAEDFVNFKRQGDGGLAAEAPDDIHQAPITTRTWFHTGAFLDEERILNQYQQEYYPSTNENLLPEPVLPEELNPDEWREALRACKGMLLRKEVYCFEEGTPEQQGVPYFVEQHNGLITLWQGRGPNNYAVFFPQESEFITYHYERVAADPRVDHVLNFEVDRFGNVLSSASVAYGRRPATGQSYPDEQNQEHVVYHVSAYTNSIDADNDYRGPLLHYKKSFEVKGAGLSGLYFHLDTLKTDCEAAAEILFHEAFGGGKQKRMLQWSRHRYRDDNGILPLPFGTLQSKGLVDESFKAAFTDSLLQAYFSDNALINIPTLTADLQDATKGGYVFADNYYWLRSGTKNYDKDHFYLSTEFTDPFGNRKNLQYDPQYFLFVDQMTDAGGNTVLVRTFNYRVLSPQVIIDPNDNLSGLRFDELGMVISTFLIGKEGQHQADEMDLSKVEVKGAADQPTSTLEYSVQEWYTQTLDPLFDSTNYKPRPNFSKASLRETFYNADAQHNTAWHVTYSYSDGGGHEVLKKIQAEPGIAINIAPDGTVDPNFDTGTALRWVGSGRVILNNKGNAVKQYEPYFSVNTAYDDEKEMVQLGVTPVLHYDAPGRVIRTDKPNGTFTKVEFSPWIQKNYDENDTVRSSNWYLSLGSPDPANPAEPSDPAVRAAWLAAKDDNTPDLTHLDSLGRTFLQEKMDGAVTIPFRTLYSVEGNLVRTIDTIDNGTATVDRVIMEYSYDMAGSKMKQNSLDGGIRWIVNNGILNPFQSWDQRLQAFGSQYDALRRLVRSTVSSNGGTPVCYERIEYIDNDPTQKADNRNGKIGTYYDQAGALVHIRFDLQDNLLVFSRQPAKEYKNIIDWSTVDPGALLGDVYTMQKKFNALKMPVSIISPHTAAMTPSEILPVYNDANLLEKVSLKLRGNATAVDIISGIHYNARGQRTDISYGNGTATKYAYEATTLRLTELTTRRSGDNKILQDLSYVYDPVGNVMQCQDAAQPDLFFDNEQVKALNKYEYDAIYRLISATGRLHAGQNDVDNTPRGDLDYFNFPFKNNASANDTGAFRNYREQYTYDRAGNMLTQVQIVKSGGWSRNFEYNNGNNQLTKTTIGSFSFSYHYDVHGNLQAMEQLQAMDWQYADQLSHADLGGGGQVYYVYDAQRQRSRKVIERLDGTRLERFYLSGFEVYREYNSAGTATLERESLHVMDTKERIALIETKTIGPNPGTLVRYQLENILGSACFELDETGKQISYEEYFPFGATSYFMVDSAREVPAKRYRYTRKERDEETGLNYHGARYYIPWLCRWTTTDRQKEQRVQNRYLYVNDNPVIYNDPTGFFNEIVHGATTYRLALAAGYTQKEAEQIAIATAGMDHDASTRPGDSVWEMILQIFRGRTSEYHFPSQAKASADVQSDINQGVPDLAQFGRHLHSLEDVGYRQAAGPHDRTDPGPWTGVPERSLSSTVFFVGLLAGGGAAGLGYAAVKSFEAIPHQRLGGKIGYGILGTVLSIVGLALAAVSLFAIIWSFFAIGQGHPDYETETHMQSYWKSHIADEPHQDPKRNTAELNLLWEDLKRGSAALHPGYVPNDAQASAIIGEVTSTNSVCRINNFFNEPAVDNLGRQAPSYVDVVTRLGRWKPEDIDSSFNDQQVHVQKRLMPNCK
jgi:RHS repeat-associated protein